MDVITKAGALAKAAWRPFAGYSFAIAMLFGLFNPDVTEGKLVVAAGVLTALGWLHSSDKKLLAPPPPSSEGE